MVNFIYTAVVKPYEENNVGEVLNETAILLCAYLMSTFFKCDDTEVSQNLGWVFMGVCAQNILVNMIMISAKVIMSQIAKYEERQHEKIKSEL